MITDTDRLDWIFRVKTVPYRTDTLDASGNLKPLWRVAAQNIPATYADSPRGAVDAAMENELIRILKQ